jgi:hypothetical protein
MDRRAIKPVQNRVGESADDTFACLAQQYREGARIIDHGEESRLNGVKGRASEPNSTS